ncbi:MAG TPA: hypothetical protein VGI22_12560, partial [Xanthobacteraceae bacterium]
PWFTLPGKCEIEKVRDPREKRIVLKRPTHGLAIAVYGYLSDYGRSYIRPLLLLLAMSGLGALPLWVYFGVADIGKAFGLSFATTFAVLGLRKDLFASELIEGLPGWISKRSGRTVS